MGGVAKITENLPLVGTKIKDQQDAFTKEFAKRADKINRRVGMDYDKDTVDKLFKRAESFIPKDAEIKPNHLIKALKKIESADKKDIDNSLSTTVKRYLKYIKNKGNKKIKIDDLLESKKTLGHKVFDKVKNNLNASNEEAIWGAIYKDIKQYGKDSKAPPNGLWQKMPFVFFCSDFVILFSC